MLVHGIVASDRFPESVFWGRIPASLRRAGLQVFPGQTDSMGSVEGNSLQLSKTIASVLKATGRSKVLILAHSKGGIDARHCVFSDKENDRIAGLVTVCTPHGGSELADTVIEKARPHKRVSKNLSRIAARLFPDQRPVPFSATVDLTTSSMALFNEKYPDISEVLYRCYHTKMESRFDDLLLSQTYQIIMRRSGPNDGIVSETSANHGRVSHEIRGIRGGISHLEILDIKRRKVSGLNIPDIWVEIARAAIKDL